MTIGDFIRLGIRRWYIFALGAACAVTGSLALKSEPWTFVANTEFVMVSPAKSAEFQSPEDARDTLINFADVVSRKFNEEASSHALSSPTATLFGNGLRKGSSVRLLNTGTQWQAAFAGPVISVQVIGSNEADVQNGTGTITSSIERITKAVQGESGVAANHYITAQTDPTRLVISAFGPTRTSRLKGTFLLTFFALCVAVLAARSLDSYFNRKLPRQPTVPLRPAEVLPPIPLHHGSEDK